MKDRLLLVFGSVAACVTLTVVSALKIYQIFPDAGFEEGHLLFRPEAQWGILAEFALMFFMAEVMFLWGWNRGFSSLKGWKRYLWAVWYFLLCCGGCFALFIVLA